MPQPIDLGNDEYDLGAAIIEQGPTDWEPHEYPPLENEAHADRLLRARSKVRAERGRVGARYDELRRQLDAWHDDISAGLDKQIEAIDQTLTDWFVAQDGDRKSVALPHGAIASRKGSRRLVVLADEETEFRNWAEEHAPGWLVPQPAKIDKATMKKSLADLPDWFGETDGTHTVATRDGEVVPGVQWETDGRKYEVKQ